MTDNTQPTGRRPWRAGLGLLLGGAMLAAPALAQQPVPPNTPGPTVPERVVPPSTGATPGVPGTPSDLKDGVIQPPAGTDPGIHVPAPDTVPGRTPVIPPPGSPGNNSPVQPR